MSQKDYDQIKHQLSGEWTADPVIQQLAIETNLSAK